MSQRFKLKMDEMQQGNPGATGYEPEAMPRDDDLYYPTYGNVRNICFVWPDGKKMFLNYAYLITGEYAADDNRIMLVFSSHTVGITGINLQPVFYKIMSQYLRLLQCVDERYNAIEPGRAVVNSIEVTANA